MSARPDLLRNLDDRAAEDVLALGSPVSLRRGEVLFRLGADATNLYTVRSGLMTLTMPIQIGGREENLRIEERAPGQTLGWSALIPPHRFTLSATAVIDSELLEFPQRQLLHLFEHRPAVGYVVSQNVAVIVGQRMQILQAMWLRQVQQMVNGSHV